MDATAKRHNPTRMNLNCFGTFIIKIFLVLVVEQDTLNSPYPLLKNFLS